MTFDRDEFERWRAEAGRALESARVLSAAGLQNWACFAAEQAAQLAVKALLHGLGKAPWGHDLLRLTASARAELGSGWPAELDLPSRRLSRHYIPARYPDAFAAGTPGMHYGPEEAAEAAADAERLLTAVDEAWRRLEAEAG